MKRLQIVFILGFVSLCSFSINAQSIIGKWQLSLDETMKYSPQEAQDEFKNAPEEQKQLARKMMEGIYFGFQNNGIVTIDANMMGEEKQESGNYVHKGNKLILTIMSKEGEDSAPKQKSRNLEILKLTNNIIVLKSLDDEKGETLAFRRIK